MSIDFIKSFLQQYKDIELDIENKDKFKELEEKSIAKTSIEFISSNENLNQRDFCLLFGFVLATNFRETLKSPEINLEQAKISVVDMCYRIKKGMIFSPENIENLLETNSTISKEPDIERKELEGGLNKCFQVRGGQAFVLMSREHIWMLNINNPYLIFYSGTPERKSFLTKFEDDILLFGDVRKFVCSKEIEVMECWSVINS